MGFHLRPSRYKINAARLTGNDFCNALTKHWRCWRGLISTNHQGKQGRREVWFFYRMYQMVPNVIVSILKPAAGYYSPG